MEGDLIEAAVSAFCAALLRGVISASGYEITLAELDDCFGVGGAGHG